MSCDCGWCWSCQNLSDPSTTVPLPGETRPDSQIGARMPRRGTRPGPPTLLLGVWGQGESTPDNVGALLDDFLEGAGNVSPRFLVPLDKELTTETITAVLDYAVEKEIPYEVVYERKPTTRALKVYIEGAAKEHQFDDKVTDDDRFESTEDAIADNFVVMLGEKPDDARLLFLWAENDKGDPDEDDQRLLAAVADCGVVALDLTQGLDVLDVGAADDGGEPEPEPEKPAKKAAAGKKTTAAKEEPVDEPEDVDYDTFKDWPIRRMKQHAKKVAAADRRDGVEGAPSDEEVDELNKDGIIDYLYPEDEPAAEPEPEPEKDEPITPRRARAMRESAEAEGKDTLAAAKRGAKKTAAASEPEPEGEDADETLRAAVSIITDVFDLGLEDEGIENVAVGLLDIFETFADVVIDRIAARVEKEPEKSAIREEIAPPRPPGKPRKDGATPTRRRTARRR